MSEKAKDKTVTKHEFMEIGKKVFAAKEKMLKQQNIVIELKKKKADKGVIKKEVNILKKLTKDVEDITKIWRKADPNKLHISKKEFDQFLVRRFFFLPSNEIYQGPAGFYDYGPPACAIQANILDYWRKHFVIEENMLEVDCSIVTPSKVLEVSGHVERFFDWMVKDVSTKECFRVDKLIEEAFERIMVDKNTTKETIEKLTTILQTLDDCKGPEFDKIIQTYEIKSLKGNKLSDSFPFNLMFKTKIGPTGKEVGYLRPETAQGIFVNFKRLYDCNNNKLPFAAAQIGKSFRNEISPKASILRVREFLQAEIEHFMDPDKRDEFDKFDNVKDVKIRFLSRENQISGKSEELMSIFEVNSQKIIQNKTLAYYIARTYLFMKNIGMLEAGIRFRQHLKSEMAHYAADCWDCELLTTYGWYEVVGLCDRTCFDVKAHQEESKQDMFARKVLKTPIITEFIKCEVNKKVFFKTFKRNSQKIMKYFNSLCDEKKKELDEEMKKGDIKIVVENEEFTIPKGFVFFKKEIKKECEKKFIPSVIEPSFGIGRTIYCLLEHSYWVREDPEKKNKIPRSVLSLVPTIAPYKTAILTTTVKKELKVIIKRVLVILNDFGLSCKVDDSGRQIGRKYARVDDIGIPFAITVDQDSVKDDCITLRERDTCFQIRIKIDIVGEILFSLIFNKKLTWEECLKKFKEQKQVASEKVGKK